jgi:CO/xanthine dehydrogenase Mo-binding subunit/CO/xanthine dehydrogenase FAD-binding subunit
VTGSRADVTETPPVEPAHTSPGPIGHPVPRTDASEKVRGRSLYVGDITLPRMLYAAVARSPHPHARVRSVDTTKARAIPGVRAVLTGADTPQRKWGVFRPDLYPLAVDRVRYVGDEVAAVAACDPDTAREACNLIEVEYEPLDAVLGLDEALGPNAALVHDDAPGNIAHHFSFERGDTDAWLSRSDVVVEGTWESQRQWHASLETIGCVADWTPDGRLTLWVNTQTPFLARNRYASALDIPESDIRVIQTEVGGGFGGKSADDNASVICALLSRRAGRPVQLLLSREEEFLASRPRMPIRFFVRLGFTKYGEVTAKDLRVVADNGAYTGKSQAVLGAATVRHDALYRYRSVRADSKLVYTNLIPTGAFRGFGNPSADWAVEQAWDLAATELGMDVSELLMQNAVESGDISPHNHRIASCELKQCIGKATDLIGWEHKRKAGHKNRGLGLGCSVHVSGRRSFGDYDGSSAMVRLDEDGRATVITGEGEIGTGAKTTLAQIAAAELGLPIADVSVTSSDTDLTTHALGALASRITYVAGNAARRASQAARESLLEAASDLLALDQDALAVSDGWIVSRGQPANRQATVASVVRQALYRPGGGPIVGVGSFDNPSEFPDESRYGNESGAYGFIAEAVEVEVDPDTGRVEVLEVAAVTDCGTVINPAMATGQIQGAIAQGLGLALTEWLDWSGDQPSQANFSDYKLPTAEAMPKISVDFAESYEPTGPFGAKGLGEIALDAIPAIIANAIHDAVGVRINKLPITAEKVFWALHDDKSSPGRQQLEPSKSSEPTTPSTSQALRPQPTRPTRIYRPTTVSEALELLGDGQTLAVAGGVDISLRQRAFAPSDQALVGLEHLDALGGLEVGQAGLHIGACNKLADLASSRWLRQQWACVSEAVSSVATARIRRMVTIGGNLAVAESSHDPPVALAAAGAWATIADVHTEREVPIFDLAGPSAAQLWPQQLLLSVNVPWPKPRTGSVYCKYLMRGVWEYACVSVACVLRLDTDHTVTSATLMLGSVGPTVLCVPTDDMLTRRFDEGLVFEIAQRAQQTARPTSDVRGSAAYKGHMVFEHTRRALKEAARRSIADKQPDTDSEVHERA